MFGDNPVQSVGNQAAPSVPPDSGITSAIKELLDAINDNSITVGNIKQALGIDSPEKGTAAAPQASSLVQVLRSAIYRVRNTNEHLYEILRHINA